MITATASTDALIRRLAIRAERAVRHLEDHARRKQRGSSADWRSARSLWPDLELD
jgi:hypothetical protein